MTTFLMRHGETEWNIAGKKQGQGNSNLTNRGRGQAKDNALLINTCIKNELKILVSPLGRAQETCDIVCSALVKSVHSVTLASELVELDYGLWQGLTDTEIDEYYPQERERRLANHWNYQIPNGESYSMLEQRVSSFLQKQELDNVLIIAHEMVNRVVVGRWLSLSQSETLKINHPHDIVYVLEGKVVRELRSNE